MSNLIASRKRIEAQIEELIEMLDILDGDSDLEDNADDEPSIGGTVFARGDGYECDLEFDSSDDEWSGDEFEWSGDEFEGELAWSNPEGLRIHVKEERDQLIENGWIH